MLLNKMIIVLTIGSGSVVQYPLNMFLAVQELILQRRASVLCVLRCVHLCCCSNQDFPRGGCGSHQDKETKPQEQCCTNAITKTYSRIKNYRKQNIPKTLLRLVPTLLDFPIHLLGQYCMQYSLLALDTSTV